MQQLRTLSAEGYTIIQTTHHPEQSYMFSDRILAVQNGRLLVDGTPADVLNNSTMKALYNVDVEVLSLYEDKLRVCLPQIM